MTRSITARSIAAGLAALAIAAAALPAEAGNKRLSQSYSYTVGDDVAMRTGGFFRVVAGLEASTLVYYDRKEQNIVSYIVGSAADVAGAKRDQAVRDRQSRNTSCRTRRTSMGSRCPRTTSPSSTSMTGATVLPSRWFAARTASTRRRRSRRGT